jgi:hypothetical protein
MFSISLKRSTATLGVLLAGLLAAAAPAGAQSSPATGGAKAHGPCGNVPAQLSTGGAESAGFVNGCAPGFARVGQSVRAGADDTLAVRGTHVGSEGVKDTAVVVLIGANDYGWTDGDHLPCCRDA